MAVIEKRLACFYRTCIFTLLAGLIITVLMMAGCGSNSSSSDTGITGGQTSAVTEKGVLNGSWGGLYTVENQQVKLDGAVQQEAGTENFFGSLSVGGVVYALTGTMKNNVIQATLVSIGKKIIWNGTYAAGRISGTFSSTSTSKDSVESSGTVGLIKFLDIQGSIRMGPWLLYSQSTQDDGDVMTIRIAVASSATAEVKVEVTDTVDNTKYNADMQIKHSTQGVDIFQSYFTNLPSNRLFSYKITIQEYTYDDGHQIKLNPYSVSASFRTPPSPADIQSGTVTSQVFYGMGDNRRLYDDDSDYLPFVEQALCTYSSLTTEPMSQTCIVHNGDCSTLGQNIDACDPMTLLYKYGWQNEWLKSSNDHGSQDKYNNDWRYHTWLRASLPTYMSPGNHDAKNYISDKAIDPGELDLFHYLMGEYPCGTWYFELTKSNGDKYDSISYANDYGGMRIITLNAYYCYSSDDASKVATNLSNWVKGANQGGPIVIIIHPALYGAHHSGATTGYWQETSQIISDLQPIINNRKNVIVIGGHQHKTCRTVVNQVNYYLIGTSGAADMKTDGDDDSMMVPLSGYGSPIYLDFAWGQFNVDYNARQITCELYHTDGRVIDTNTWSY